MLESIKKNKKGILLMLISSIFVCVGQLLWKLANGESVTLLGIGFVLYGIGALIMIIAYKHGSLSVLQPVLSMNYVIAILLGYFILGEVISIEKLLGITIIIAGVILIGGSDE